MKQRLPAKRTTGWTSNLLAAAGDVLVPLLFAFGVGSIFSLICGCNPFTLYSYIIKKAFFSVGGLLNTLGYTTPIIITGMATALSIRANIVKTGLGRQKKILLLRVCSILSFLSFLSRGYKGKPSMTGVVLGRGRFPISI